MKMAAITLQPGLVKTILKAGNGVAFPKAGQTAVVHYVGKLTNGTTFDSSRAKGRPFSFQVGAGRVIKGWDAVLPSMSIGEVCEAKIDAPLAYGPSGIGGVIPPNATLVFEIELLEIR